MKRCLNGIFLLDKPTGISSNQALQKVKRLFNAEKAGHTGSLDPSATGMLPICFGEATKFSQHLLDANKIYEVTAQLGVRTDTGDSEGRVIFDFMEEKQNRRALEVSFLEHPSPRGTPALRNESSAALSRSIQDLGIEEKKLLEVLKRFTGTIQQVPPMHSALKHQGRPLYDYARKGETIDRPARTVTIYDLALLSTSLTGEESIQSMALRVHCSKGTYIRSLIDDMGVVLGCGAHVIALRRTMVEPFQSFSMMTLDMLEASQNRDQYLLPMDTALAEWPRQILNNETAKQLLQGKLITLSPPFKTLLTCFYSESGQFLGVGMIHENGQVSDTRLVSMTLSGLFS